MVRHSGFIEFNGNGLTTVFTIPHSCPKEPYFISAEAATPDTLGIVEDGGGNPCLQNTKTYIIGANATDIIVTYPLAPPAGTNNIGYYWSAECQ